MEICLNQGLMCLAEGHNAVTPVRLKPTTPWSTALPNPIVYFLITVYFLCFSVLNEISQVVNSIIHNDRVSRFNFLLHEYSC